MTYDPACLELARHFLSDAGDTDEDRHELAIAIQNAVEAWIWWREENGDKSKIPAPPP